MRKVIVPICALVLLILPAIAAGTDGVQFNEIFASMTGTDNQEYIELCGPADLDLTGYYVLIIEGDSTSNTGALDRLWDLTGQTMPADGYFVLVDDGSTNVDFAIGASDRIENGTETIVLATNVTASLNDDLDADDDGVLDGVFYTEIEGVGMRDAGVDDLVYTSYVVGPDGTNFPAGVTRCDDCSGPLDVFMCFGISTCDVNTDGYANISPGLPNVCPVVATIEHTWGAAKSLYR